ncbi:MAG: hypothetical protein ACKO3P_11715, partial [Planctomycetaceae bacterium]
MSSRRQPAPLPPPEAFQSRSIAHSASQQLESHAVAALPILNHLLERIQLPQILQSMLPREDRRVRVPA